MAIHAYRALGQPHPCSYLPRETCRLEMLQVARIDPADIEALLALGYRHFGSQFFRPACPGCRSCVPLRVRVDAWRPRRADRRALERAGGLAVEISEAPRPSREAYRLYCGHKERFRDTNPDADPGDYDSFVGAFYEPFPCAWTLALRDADRLVAVMHFDRTPRALSAVYCYWDPADAALSPGRVALLNLANLARQDGLTHLYLGFWIAENPHMSYKAGMVPHEIMAAPGVWTAPVDGRTAGTGADRAPDGGRR
ncbi:MAG: GNAT family N-acetyltransferase [Lentisphaerae bacterium]|nr:GNAT family N-acetyltransferase [Lentisphaerota bacterium]